MEETSGQLHMASSLSYNLKQEYSDIFGFVRDRIEVSIVKSNTLFIQGPWYKESHIWHQLELTDEALMSPIEMWRI